VTLPTFFIIGAAKAGTTSLHYYLDQHPQIQMSANKEPNFFSGPENGVPYPWGRVSRLEDYEGLFDPTVAVRGEASTGYASHPRRQNVPQRIKEHVPQAKFIYLVRDPIVRTVSQYQHRVAIEGERRSLREALGDLSDPNSVYTCPSLYASQLDLYLRHFPRERLLVVDQAELLADRRSTLRQIFSFLSVDDRADVLQFDQELNTSRQRRVYSPGYAHLRYVWLRGSDPPMALRWIPRRIRRRLRLSLERLLLSPVQTPTLDDALRTQLQELYSGEVERLRALTGKTFSTWSM
jgi:hypothetical protein